MSIPTTATPAAPSQAATAPSSMGRNAARIVLYTPELGQQIFAHLDRYTLAGMLRLEKAATAFVAAAVYKEVDIKLVSKLKRDTPRTMAYCDAVRIIQKSPPPKFTDRFKEVIKPKAVNLKSLHTSIKSWRKKFPNLHTVLFEQPAEDWDDSYVVHISDGVITVDLCSAVEVNIFAGPCPPLGPTLPPPPSHPGLVIRHTISLHAVLSDGEPLSWAEQEKWAEGLCGPNLDRRVTSISDDRAYDELDLNFEDFLRNRIAGKCELPRKFSILYSQTLEEFREVAMSVGPQLRSLAVSTMMAEKLGLENLIPIIDAAFPSLLQLVIENASSMTCLAPAKNALVPLSGLPHLRKFFSEEIPSDNYLATARRLWRVGARDCLFRNTYQTAKERKHITDLIDLHKSRVGLFSLARELS